MKHALIFCIIFELIMAGIDRFLSTQLSEIIKRKLEPDILKEVERKVFLEYGMSIKLSIEHFDQFLDALKKNSSVDINRFQKDSINELIRIKKLDGKYSIKIVNDALSQIILQLIGDVESRKIIVTILENELTIPDILKESKVPKTSGYRKIDSMILNGIIVETGRILSESKKVSKFRACFDQIKTNLDKNNLEMEVIMNRELFEKSSSIRAFI